MGGVGGVSVVSEVLRCWRKRRALLLARVRTCSRVCGVNIHAFTWEEFS